MVGIVDLRSVRPSLREVAFAIIVEDISMKNVVPNSAPEDSPSSLLRLHF